jgi:hypothetical protein
MARVLTGLLTLATALGCCCPAARAQETGADRIATSTALSLSVAGIEVSPLLPPPAEPPRDLPGPYLVPDPLLDPPQLPPLGWFAETDAALLLMHIERNSFLAMPPPLVAAGAKGGLNGLPLGYVPQAHLNPLVSPRLQFGYRLPAGFGEIALSYRFMATMGDQVFVNNNGPASLRGRFDFNVADLTYASHELSLWSWADMRWHIGLRFANVFFDDRLSQPFALAAGDGVIEQRFSDHFYGFGPVFGLQLSGNLHEQMLSWLIRVEGSWVFGRISQSYSQFGPAVDAGGSPLGFRAPFSTSQDAPNLNVQAGLCCRPRPGLDLFAGYQFEYWWEVGRLGGVDSRGEFYDQGIVLRASYCW